jgi:hypothetical protein
VQIGKDCQLNLLQAVPCFFAWSISETVSSMQWQHLAFKRMNVGDSVMTPSEAEVNLSEDMQVILKYIMYAI